MSDWTRKTRHAGPPVRDLRKKDKEPARTPPNSKPRLYELKVTTTTVHVWTERQKFGTKAAREQAKADHRKKAEQYRGFNWRNSKDRSTQRTVEFEESEHE